MISAAVRLVAALEELITAETLALRAGDVRTAALMQRRAAPLITALDELRQTVGLPIELMPRLRDIAARRQQNQVCVAAMKARLLPELERVRIARRRLVTGVAPAYRRPRRKTTVFARA